MPIHTHFTHIIIILCVLYFVCTRYIMRTWWMVNGEQGYTPSIKFIYAEYILAFNSWIKFSIISMKRWKASSSDYALPLCHISRRYSHSTILFSIFHLFGSLLLYWIFVVLFTKYFANRQCAFEIHLVTYYMIIVSFLRCFFFFSFELIFTFRWIHGSFRNKRFIIIIIIIIKNFKKKNIFTFSCGEWRLVYREMGMGNWNAATFFLLNYMPV